MLHVGYLTNTYPRPSHSFIRREIAALERQGVVVHRFAMRSDVENLKDPADIAENQRTEHILDQGGRRILGRLIRMTIAAPGRVLPALRRAWSRSRAGESGFGRQIIYLAEGAAIAERAQALGLSHIHAHFGTNSTRVAAYAQMLGGPAFSFTAHGPEEFDKCEPLDLGGKIGSAKFCVAVSNFGRSQLFRWAGPDDWQKVKVIHCGIEPQNWPEPAPMPQLDKLRMVAIGRFAEQKGFGLLIAAFAKAFRKNPNLHLSLVGDGPLRPEIEEVIRREGIADAVDLLGWQDEAGVRRALDASHVLIVPSFAEGLPVVIMEAMASGRAILATYIAGIPELVRPGLEGWLVPAGSTEALVDGILTAAAADPTELQRMGASARERVLARHDVNRSAQMLAAHFAR